MIRYKPKDYAKALLEAIKNSPRNEKGVFNNFIRVLAKRRDFAKWRQIKGIFEKLYIQEFKEKWFDVYVARDSKDCRSKVMKVMPRGADAQFHVDPSLIGGIKILLNKEILIDGSAQRRINQLFNYLS